MINGLQHPARGNGQDMSMRGDGRSEFRDEFEEACRLPESLCLPSHPEVPG